MGGTCLEPMDHVKRAFFVALFVAIVVNLVDSSTGERSTEASEGHLTSGSLSTESNTFRLDVSVQNHVISRQKRSFWRPESDTAKCKQKYYLCMAEKNFKFWGCKKGFILCLAVPPHKKPTRRPKS